MERTFSLEARAVVPTTEGFTSAMPSAGSIRISVTSTTRGMALRTGASHGEPIEPSRKYEMDKIR